VGGGERDSLVRGLGNNAGSNIPAFRRHVTILTKCTYCFVKVTVSIQSLVPKPYDVKACKITERRDPSIF
jgi:hypothetical protein